MQVGNMHRYYLKSRRLVKLRHATENVRYGHDPTRAFGVIAPREIAAELEGRAAELERTDPPSDC
jgi:hypothetical protein